jgi:hypothetical protein
MNDSLGVMAEPNWFMEIWDEGKIILIFKMCLLCHCHLHEWLGDAEIFTEFVKMW